MTTHSGEEPTKDAGIYEIGNVTGPPEKAEGIDETYLVDKSRARRKTYVVPYTSVLLRQPVPRADMKADPVLGHCEQFVIPVIGNPTYLTPEQRDALLASSQHPTCALPAGPDGRRVSADSVRLPGGCAPCTRCWWTSMQRSVMLPVGGGMAGKYQPLGEHLRACAKGGDRRVELSFGTVDRLVDGLPLSARRLRTWWSNSSHVQASAWRQAGWHVHSVDLAARRAVFMTGQVGGDEVRRQDVQSETDRRTTPPAARRLLLAVYDLPLLGSVDVAIRFTWHDAGSVILDLVGKPAFPALPEAAGLYRFTLAGRAGQGRGRVCIGEADSLRRRLGHYRNPGPGNRRTCV